MWAEFARFATILWPNPRQWGVGGVDNDPHAAGVGTSPSRAKGETFSPLRTLLNMTSKSEPADLLMSVPSPADVSSCPGTDLANLTQAQGGDREAFVALYDTHVRAVYWFTLKMVRSTADAEDITQDTFVIAWSKRHAIRPVDQSVLPWLLVTARNLGNNLIRSRTRDEHHRTDSDLSNFPDPQHRSVPDEVENRMLLDAIDHAVCQLSETDQTLYYLCIDEGLSYEQAARALGTSHGVVRNRLARVRITLRGKLSAQKEALS